MQLVVASIIKETLTGLPLRYPASDPAIQAEKHDLIAELMRDPVYNPELESLKKSAKQADKAWEKADKAEKKVEKKKQGKGEDKEEDSDPGVTGK